MGDKVTEYRILRQRFVYYDKPIEEQVTEALADGYELLGAPFTETTERQGPIDSGDWEMRTATCQAVVRRHPVLVICDAPLRPICEAPSAKPDPPSLRELRDGYVDGRPVDWRPGWLARLLPGRLP